MRRIILLALASGIATMTLTTTPVNAAPVANPDSTNTIEDVSVTIDVLANDNDPEGTPLTITDMSTTNGVVVNNGTNVVFTPDRNFNGTVVFSYAISNGTNTAMANVTVTVDAVNDRPIPQSDRYDCVKNVTLNIPAPGVLANDTDAENDALTASLAAGFGGVYGVSHGTLIFNADGSFTYTPSNNYVGSDHFVYSVTDGSSDAPTFAEVIISVAATNTPPVAYDQNIVLVKNTSTYFVLVGSDIDGDLLRYSEPTGPAHGTFFSYDGHHVYYTPDVGFVGTDSFTFLVTDGRANSQIATVTLTVVPSASTPVADIAVLKSGPLSMTEGARFNYTITVTNRGPSRATGVVVRDFLPTNLTFVSASAGGRFARNTVTWPRIAALTNGAAKNFTLTVVANALGMLTNIASATTSTVDSNPRNNNGSSSSSHVTTTVTPPGPAQFGFFIVTNVFNPKTSLYEERVVITNISGAAAAALRVYATGLRAGVYLQNASGTNAGKPYVHYNVPLPAGSNVTFLLGFLSQNRLSFTNGIEVEITAPILFTPGTPVANLRILLETDATLGESHPVIKFPAILGRSYTILYGDNGPNSVTNVATPNIKATANAMQWIDTGPPKTATKPSARFYRVILLP